MLQFHIKGLLRLTLAWIFCNLSLQINTHFSLSVHQRRSAISQIILEKHTY